MNVTGSLQIRNGIYHMMVRIPTAEGKYLQKSKSTGIREQGSSKREARQNKLKADQLLAEWVSDLETGEAFTSTKLFLSCVEEWLARKKRRVRVDTYEAYECYYDCHIKPFFAPLRLRLDEITPRLIQKYVDRKEEAGLSPNSINKHLVVLNGVFKEAIALREATFNPCASVTLTKKDSFKGSAYDPEEAKRLLEAIRGDPVEPAVYLGLYLGLRRSEVTGLRWQDVDFEANVVHIRNTVVRFKTISEQEKTKSRASKRDLYLPSGLKAYLTRLKAQTELNRTLFGASYQHGDHICQWANGKNYTPDYITRRFNRVLELNELPHIRFHDLRHTAGSLLINQGQSVKQVQEFLGHEKAATTLDIYTHLSLEGKKDTAQKLDELLSGETDTKLLQKSDEIKTK